MSLLTIHWPSKALAKQVATTILLPNDATPPFPAYYLLHGLTDDHTTWLRQTRIEAFASQYPLAIVMPDGARSYYCNLQQGPAYADFIALELPEFIEKNFPIRSDRQSRCIGGNSMGGYGALRAALAYPDRYVSANSHSGALNITRRINLPQQIPEYASIFGPNPSTSLNDLSTLIQKITANSAIPHLRLDCGHDDFLLNESRFLHTEFERLKIPHEYDEYPGFHGWDYWNEHLPKALAFHAKALGLKK